MTATITSSKFTDRDRPTVHIALVPLDERPVNVQIPIEVAQIAGSTLELPPAEAMPVFRAPADFDSLAAWVRDIGSRPAVTRLVVCIDTLVFGGIIPARITGQGVTESVGRLDVLREVAKSRPDVAILAASLVMRASDSYSAVEEPKYWSEYGRELHRFGGDLHKAVRDDIEGTPVDAGATVHIPERILRDFEARRLRNHIVNLTTIALHEEGTIDTLAITADDTAPLSAGSIEQTWLRHWQRALPRGREVLSYPGADEVGAVLVARALVKHLRPPVIQVKCGEYDGLERVPNFENVSLRDSIARQIAAIGGRIAGEGETADIVLVAHAPDPAHGDYFGAQPAGDPAATAATIATIEQALESGALVALADVRFSNGADPELVDELARRGTLLKLAAYAGWNTAGNSIGSALAHAVARWGGAQTASVNLEAAKRALLTRIVEDRGYQSGIRQRIQREILGGSIKPVSPKLVRAACAAIQIDLQEYLTQLTGGGWQVMAVTLPWQRSFEIELTIAPSIG